MKCPMCGKTITVNFDGKEVEEEIDFTCPHCQSELIFKIKVLEKARKLLANAPWMQYRP